MRTAAAISRRAAGSHLEHSASVDSESSGAEQRDRSEQAADAHAAGAHRGDLDVARHAPDREQHAEQERDRQRVDREHRAEQAHDAQQVVEREARADQLVEHAHEAARHHHDRDRREADQRVRHDLARHVQRQGAGPAHSRAILSRLTDFARLRLAARSLPPYVRCGTFRPPPERAACPESTSVASNA